MPGTKRQTAPKKNPDRRKRRQRPRAGRPSVPLRRRRSRRQRRRPGVPRQPKPSARTAKPAHKPARPSKAAPKRPPRSLRPSRGRRPCRRRPRRSAAQPISTFALNKLHQVALLATDLDALGRLLPRRARPPLHGPLRPARPCLLQSRQRRPADPVGDVVEGDALLPRRRHRRRPSGCSRSAASRSCTSRR